MNKDALIYYSFKYNGEYNAIVKAIKNDEPYKILKLDNVFTILDKCYPAEFLTLDNPPFVLYYKGDLSLLKKNKVAVVGSRIIDDKIKNNTIKIVDELNKNYITVSGLAKGVDAIAHFYCKNYQSIAFLGCGIDYIYPLENKYLYDLLTKNGLIISEYPKDVAPLKYHFPFRNRLIVALGLFLVVPFIKDKSGTMTSVEMALNLGKEIYVLGMNLLDDEYCYNNKLIKEGANILTLDDLR